MLAEYRKSAVAIIGAIVTVLAVAGFNLDPQVVAAVTTLVTAGLVWFVPNGDPGFDDQGRDDRLDP